MAMTTTTTPSSIFITLFNNNSTSSSNEKDDSHDEKSMTALWVCAILIGIVGCVANLLELIEIYRKQKKKEVTTAGVDLLSINQNVLDVIACLFLSLSYAIKQTKIVLAGSQGDWLCDLFYSDTLIWIGLTGSIANQVIVAFLLYVEAKHISLYKKLFRRWIIFFLVALTWIDGAALNNPFALSNYVKNGVCYSTGLWTSTAGHVAFGVWAFIWEYLLPVTSTAFCYGSIVWEVRRGTTAVSPSTSSATADHSEPGGGGLQPTHGSAASRPILLLYKTNSVKAKVGHMMLYAMFWCPCHVCLLVLSWRFHDFELDEAYTAGLCLGCLQISLLGPLVNRLIKRTQEAGARGPTESSSTQNNGDVIGERMEVGGENNSQTVPSQK